MLSTCQKSSMLKVIFYALVYTRQLVILVITTSLPGPHATLHKPWFYPHNNKIHRIVVNSISWNLLCTRIETNFIPHKKNLGVFQNSVFSWVFLISTVLKRMINKFHYSNSKLHFFLFFNLIMNSQSILYMPLWHTNVAVIW